MAETVVVIRGMTCANCDIAVERALAAIPGVESVRADYGSGTACIRSQEPVEEATIRAVLSEEGYSIGADVTQPPLARRFAEAGAAILIVFAVFTISRHFGLATGVSVTDHMTLGVVFVIGLLASISSCIAVTGGLLVALAAKYNEATRDFTAAQRFVPHACFNAGRLLSYTGFGALIGFAGSIFALSPLITGVFTIALSALMIVIGLQMLGLLPPFHRFLPVLPRSLLHRIHGLVERGSKTSAFMLGAVTFFLPCGFTLALQFYVLAQGSAIAGAITMFVFALGTLPALLALSLLSTFTHGTLQMRFLKIAGAAIVFLGIMNIQYGLVQTGSGYIPVIAGGSATAAEPVTARQVVEMKVVGLEYVPNRFIVKAGMPVEWRIDASEAEGCGRILVSRSLRVQKFLSSEEPTVITFTPNQPGEYKFNCSMGMMTPNSGFEVID